MAKKIKISNCPCKGIGVEELNRAREVSGLTLAEVTAKMNQAGWGWCNNKLWRYEHGKDQCHLHPDEMADLLRILGATGCSISDKANEARRKLRL